MDGSAGEVLYQSLRAIVDKLDSDMSLFIQQIRVHQYEQTVKSKKKEMKMELVKQSDFLAEVDTYVNISGHQELIETLQTLLQIDQKYPDVFQIKLIETLMAEVIDRYKKELLDKKTLEEFY